MAVVIVCFSSPAGGELPHAERVRAEPHQGDGGTPRVRAGQEGEEMVSGQTGQQSPSGGGRNWRAEKTRLVSVPGRLEDEHHHGGLRVED